MARAYASRVLRFLMVAAKNSRNRLDAAPPAAATMAGTAALGCREIAGACEAGFLVVSR